MESVNALGTIDEEVLHYYFPDFKENINVITCNKYIVIDRKKKQTKKDGTRQQQKGKVSKMEWFENLEIQQRIEAISTIATENIPLVMCIKDDIKKIEEKYSKIDEKYTECTSNQEQITLNSCNDEDKSYFSQNWFVSSSPDSPECIHEIIQNITFLDFISSEDTISVHEDLVSDSKKFFSTLDKCWEELQCLEFQANPNISNTLELILCGKIVCLIELALSATYSRSINDKRNFYQRSYVESRQAIWNLNKEIMTENLLLNEEILAFMVETIKDIDLAYEYQNKNNIFIKEDKNSSKSQEDQAVVEISNDDIIMDIMRHIKLYRFLLISLICPNGDSEHGYEITKSQEQLYDIIDKTRLYKNGEYDEKTRYFARYFYSNLLNKSREVMTERLIQEDCLDSNPDCKEGAKCTKKGAKAKRRKRNKNKVALAGKEETITQNNEIIEEKTVVEDNIKFQNIFNEEEEDKFSQAMKSTTESIKMCNDSNSKLQTTEIMKELRSISVNQETRSEHDKEDQYKLENDLYEEHECVKLNEFETKHAIKNIISKPQNSKQNYLYQKGTSSLSTKGCEKTNFIHTHYDSDIESNFGSPSQEKETKRKDYPNISNSSDVVSLKSESKSFDKELATTKQACQVPQQSSAKCIQVVSKIEDNKEIPSCLKGDENNHNFVSQAEWITSANKKTRGSKNKKSQKDPKSNAKKGKPNKKKNKSNKKQPSKEPNSCKEADLVITENNIKLNTECIPTVQINQSSAPSSKKVEKNAEIVEIKNSSSSSDKKITKTEVKMQNEQNTLKEGPPKYNNSKKSTITKNKEESKQVIIKGGTSESSHNTKSEPMLKKNSNKNSTKSSNDSACESSTIKTDNQNKLVNYEESKVISSNQKRAIPNESNRNCEEEKVIVEDGLNEFRAKTMQLKNSNSYSAQQSSTKAAVQSNTPDYSMYSPQEIEYMRSLDHSQYCKMMYEKILYQKLSAEIDEETVQITIMVNMIQKYRQSIKQALEKIAIKTFSDEHQNIEAHIFGSIATELALPESDMDIVVTGINNYGSKIKLQSNITMLFNSILENMNNKVLIKCTKILNTKVPIIKLTFNLSEYYDECSNLGTNVLPYINFDSIDSINPHLKELSVDISISDIFDESSHLGLLQSNYVREKLQEEPVLRPVCLMLKKLLVKHDLNDPYTGGLGSFSIFVMLYAALYFERSSSNVLFQSENTYKARLFAYFLSYYGECFNVESHTLFFPDKNMPMVVPKIVSGFDDSSFKKTLCVYDPTNSKNNTTQKAFRIEEIQKLFKSTKEKITNDYAEILKHKSTKSKILFS